MIVYIVKISTVIVKFTSPSSYYKNSNYSLKFILHPNNFYTFMTTLAIKDVDKFKYLAISTFVYPYL